MATYLTTNKNGLFFFQIRLPDRIRSACNGRLTFRKSLRCYNKGIAIVIARRWWLVFDELIKLWGHDPEKLGRIMTLLAAYKQVEGLRWQVVEEWLSGLEGGDEALLEAGLMMVNTPFNTGMGDECTSMIHSRNIPQIPSQESPKIIPQTIPQARDEPSQIPSQIPSQESPKIIPKSEKIKNKNSGISIQDLSKRFLTHKKDTTSPSTFSSYQSRINNFIKYFTDISIEELSPEHIRYYRDSLSKTLKKNGQPISISTIKHSIEGIKQFLDYIESEGYKIDSTLKNVFKITNRLKTNPTIRDSYSPEDLSQLFPKKFLKKTEADFWAPLISLYTGCRLAEILQLHKSDIYLRDNIYVIDINSKHNKQLKTENSARIIPVHKKLIELGFIKYVLSRDLTLFDEKRTLEGKFSNFSQRYNYYKNSVLDPRENKLDFHSFRHTVRSKLTENGIEERVINSIMGHSEKKIGLRTYNHYDFFKEKIDAINSLDFQIL